MRLRGIRKAAAVVGLAAAGSALLAASASAVIYSPAGLVFAKQTAGTVSAPQNVSVGGGYCGPDFFDGMNIQPGPCFPEASDIAVSGSFVITANTCPASLHSPTATSIPSCTVSVAFAPTTSGAQAGFLRLVSSPSIQGVPLSGTGCRTLKRKHHKKKLTCKTKAKKKGSRK